MDRAAFILHVEQRLLEAHALTLFAYQFDVGEKLHFLYLNAVAFAALAASARHIEAEVRRVESVSLSFARRSEQIANRIVDLDVRNRVRARRAAYRRLIDEHDIIQVLRSVNPSDR